MKVAEYVAKFAGVIEELILDIFEELDNLLSLRKITTVNGLQALFEELDKKYRMIVEKLDLQVHADLFYDTACALDPQLKMQTNGRLIPYIARQY